MKTAKERIQDISKKFEMVESLVSDEVQETVQEELEVIKKGNYNPLDVMSIEVIADDFNYSRETLKNLITNGRLIIDKLTIKYLEDPDNFEMPNYYSEIMKIISDSIKIYNNVYKEFTSALLNLKKIEQNETKQPNSVTNNLVIETENVSTLDIISQLKKL